MNTNPDEIKLAQWLDDELQGEELAAFEIWAGSRPEHVAARAEVRRWRELMAAALPASEQPPYPDFFNTRVARVIREPTPEPVMVPKRRFAWQSLFLPVAACAGMALTFWLGAQMHTVPSPAAGVAGAPRTMPVEPMVYTPENGVDAERFASPNASATVIVLNGVDAIPDATDFPDGAARHTERDSDSTGDVDPDSTDHLSL